jgi:hypothetical protein
MVGMPSPGVTQLINDSTLINLGMRGYVAAELRRLQRAIGMSTWDIMTSHNRQVSGMSEVTTLVKIFPGGGFGVFLLREKSMSISDMF